MSRPAARAAGIDLGGTKIETQAFSADWSVLARRRRDTPRDYGALVAAMAEEVAWAEALGPGLPVGVAAAGLVDPRGLAYTANLPATGRPFPADIAQAAGRPVLYVNDCRALTLSEAAVGAARGLSPVAGLILGTGVGGGLAVGGRLVAGPSGTGGEFGHTPAAAHVVAAHGLPVVPCGCGRVGCVETFVAGPGLVRLGRHFGLDVAGPPDLVGLRGSDARARRAWDAWCDVVAELLLTLTFMADPAAVVLGGGLSRIEGVLDDLAPRLARAQLPGFAVPRLLLAEGGDSSGARGAALAASA